MSNFVDLGNIRAKYDFRNEVIRLTSSEDGLKENGFMVTLHRGSKEYDLLIDRIAKNNESGEIKPPDKNVFPKMIQLSEKYKLKNPFTIPIGLKEDKEISSWDTTKNSWLSITGSSGSGKSSVLANILSHISDNPLHWQAEYVPRTEFVEPLIEKVRDKTFSENISIHGTSNLHTVLLNCYKTIEKRIEFVNQNSTYELNNKIQSGNLKRIMLCLDETVNKMSKNEMILLSDILYRGKNVGVNVTLATHGKFLLLPFNVKGDSPKCLQLSSQLEFPHTINNITLEEKWEATMQEGNEYKKIKIFAQPKNVL